MAQTMPYYPYSEVSVDAGASAGAAAAADASEELDAAPVATALALVPAAPVEGSTLRCGYAESRLASMRAASGTVTIRLVLHKEGGRRRVVDCESVGVNGGCNVHHCILPRGNPRQSSPLTALGPSTSPPGCAR